MLGKPDDRPVFHRVPPHRGACESRPAQGDPVSATATGATVPGTIPTAGAAPTVGATPTAGAAPAPAHAPGRGASTRRTMPGLLAAALGLFLAAHGLAHLVGALAMFGVRSGEATDGMETYVTYDGLAATIMGVAWCVGFA